MKKNILFIILILLIIKTKSVFADTVNVSLFCDKTASIKDLVKCDIKVSPRQANVKMIDAKISIQNNVSLKDVVVSNNIKKTIDSNNNLKLENINTDNVASLYFSIDNAPSVDNYIQIGLTNIKVLVDSEIVNLEDKYEGVEFSLNYENKLTSLEIDNANISPKFNPVVTNYKLSTKMDEILLRATTNNNAKIVFVNSNDGKYKLNLGENKISIKVISFANTSRIYELNVIREDNREENFDIRLLKIGKYRIDLEKDKFEYELSVDFNTKLQDVEVKTSSDKSKVEILTTKDFEVGDNDLLIKVISEKETSKEYKIKVKKLERELYSNNYLKSLIIKNHKIYFSKNILDYDLVVSSLKKLEIDAITEDDSAFVKIIGNENLKDKSKVIIEVKAENGEVRNYVINIKLKNNLLLIILLTLLILSVIGILLYLFLKKKKKDVEEVYVSKHLKKEDEVEKDNLEDTKEFIIDNNKELEEDINSLNKE